MRPRRREDHAHGKKIFVFLLVGFRHMGHFSDANLSEQSLQRTMCPQSYTISRGRSQQIMPAWRKNSFIS